MKDTVTDVGAFRPTTAVIRAAAQGDYVVSTISVRDRLVKGCISLDIKRIIILVPPKQVKPPYIAYANEKSSAVEYAGELAEISISDRESTVYIEDGFLIRASLLEGFLAANARIMRSPSGRKNIFSKDDFTAQTEISYTKNDIFNGEPFHMFELQQDNIPEARFRLFKWLDKDSDGFISRKLNRPVSTFFSRFFAEYPIPPIYFTGLTAILAVLMTYVLMTGGEPGILWGSILFHVASVADGIDGEIARAKFQTSLKGAKLDTTIDMITNILFMGGMSYALWNTYGDTYLILGVYIVVLALMGVLLMTALIYFGPGGGRFDVLADVIRARYTERPVLSKIFNFSNYCLKRDFFAFLFAVLGVFELAKYIPEFLIFGLTVWNLAIIVNARSLLKLKPSAT